jgi:glycosyltransferase involved in cell wall biosynthesis
MIYICVPSSNDAATVGLALWKVRQVFLGLEREYHLLVADDASTDQSAQVLEPYQRALPMSLIRHETPKGYAATVSALLLDALRRSDHPKRDAAILLPADFSISGEQVPALVRRLDSGADLVVGEAMNGASFGLRMVQRSAPWLLRPGLHVPGARDLTSGFCAIRLVTLKHLIRDGAALLDTDGWCANAELVARAAAHARRISLVEVPRRTPPARVAKPLTLALELFRAGRRLRIAAPTAEIERAS